MPKLQRHDLYGVKIALELVQMITGKSWIITICQECQNVLGIKDGKGIADVSHGLCDGCKAEQLAYLRAGGR